MSFCFIYSTYVLYYTWLLLYMYTHILALCAPQWVSLWNATAKPMFSGREIKEAKLWFRKIGIKYFFSLSKWTNRFSSARLLFQSRSCGVHTQQFLSSSSSISSAPSRSDSRRHGNTPGLTLKRGGDGGGGAPPIQLASGGRENAGRTNAPGFLRGILVFFNWVDTWTFSVFFLLFFSRIDHSSVQQSEHSWWF